MDRWDHLDAWRQRWREAADVDSRREAVAAWAAAAGGEVRDGTLRLPSGLPRCLARAEMTANAGYVGIMLDDGTAAHHACHERAEVGRIRARAANALSRPALADEAELTMRGEPLP